MHKNSSRRRFLAAGISLPAAGLAATSSPPRAQSPSADLASAEPKVEYRKLGSTGLEVSSLGFGCMLASDPMVLERALDLGINYFDTARVYQGGNNERMVGAALKGRRDQVVLASKARTSTREGVLEELETSLQELGTDYLDVWFLHNKNDPEEISNELLEAQEVAKRDGKIRFAGISFHFNMDSMLPYVVGLGKADVALLSYNFTLGPEVGTAIEQARAKGMGIIGMKVMAGGYARIQRGDRLYGQDPGALTARLRKPSAMLAALKWTLRNRSVDTAIIGITDFAELEEDMRAMCEPYSDRDEALLSAQLERIRPDYCRACGRCGGTCDQGVDIAGNLRYLMYAEGYGQFSLGREQYLAQAPSQRPGACTECRSCTVTCPNGVTVRDNLIRAQNLFA
jgi:predicted aldo/keto reductase-like oxidoreductase